jgi:DNA-binding FadR family transcriptional regulator
VKRFKSIKQERKSLLVFNQLKSAILSGQYRPGQKMPPERELTEQFQVSRVVVREAIRELELKGFARIQKGQAGGAFVADLGFDNLCDAFLDLFLASKMSVSELMQARLHLEPEIARLAAVNADAESIDRLNEALVAETRPVSSHAERISRRFEVDRLLAEMCGNRLYQAIANALIDLAKEIILVVKPMDTVIFQHEEHEEIVYAVSAHDASAAAQAVTKHIACVGEQLVNLEKTYRQHKGVASAQP